MSWLPSTADGLLAWRPWGGCLTSAVVLCVLSCVRRHEATQQLKAAGKNTPQHKLLTQKLGVLAEEEVSVGFKVAASTLPLWLWPVTTYRPDEQELQELTQHNLRGCMHAQNLSCRWQSGKQAASHVRKLRCDRLHAGFY
jgi:hypothetical protein